MTENEFATEFLEGYRRSKEIIVAPEVSRGSNAGRRPGHFDAVMIHKTNQTVIAIEFKTGNPKSHYRQCKKACEASRITTVGINSRPVPDEYKERCGYDYFLHHFEPGKIFSSTIAISPLFSKDRNRIYYNPYAMLLYYSYLYHKNENIDYSTIGTAAAKREMIPDIFRRACVNLFRSEGKVLSFRVAYGLFGTCVYSQSTALRYYKEAVKIYKTIL